MLIFHLTAGPGAVEPAYGRSGSGNATCDDAPVDTAESRWKSTEAACLSVPVLRSLLETKRTLKAPFNSDRELVTFGFRLSA
jgi:hypothetical protein